jgi:hypothetical protein
VRSNGACKRAAATNSRLPTTDSRLPTNACACAFSVPVHAALRTLIPKAFLHVREELTYAYAYACSYEYVMNENTRQIPAK